MKKCKCGSTDLVGHHVSYDPEVVTYEMCWDCHGRYHKKFPVATCQSCEHRWLIEKGKLAICPKCGGIGDYFFQCMVVKFAYAKKNKAIPKILPEPKRSFVLRKKWKNSPY